MPFQPGFDPNIAKALIGISAQMEGASPPLPDPPMPENWKLIFDSPSIGLTDNKWQLWQTDTGDYAADIRGTMITAGSILLDLMALLIPAQGKLSVGPCSFAYNFSDEPGAGITLGFALGAMVLLFDKEHGMLTKLKELPEGTNVIIAGHSQGAAVATLVQSFLRLYSDLKLNYKMYVLAQPKPGNNIYARDFEYHMCNSGMAFHVVNNLDWVPQVPFTLQWLCDLSEPNPLDLLKVPYKEIDKVLGEVDIARKLLKFEHLKRHHPQLEELGRIMGEQNHIPLESTHTKDLTIMDSLNFTNCASPIVLKGIPGVNPDDKDDFTWQHHAAMYYKLLNKDFPAT